MVNKKTIITGIFVAFVMLVISLYTGQLTQTSESSVPNVKAPPTTSSDTLSSVSIEAVSIQPREDIQTLELSENDGNVVCDKPSKDAKYGGISGSADNPPRGTTVVESKTDNRITATGTCGTYWYISGWWFSASEIANLPSDTIMYGVSPYAMSEGSGRPAGRGEQPSVGTTPGGDGSDKDNADDGDGNGNGDDEPVVPVPEVATVALVIVGLLVFVAWNKKESK